VPDNSFQDGTDPIATDEISGGVADGVKVARSKTGFGTDGTYVDVDADNPLPVTLAPAAPVDLLVTADAYTAGDPAADWIQLGDHACLSVTIKALRTNTGDVYVAGQPFGAPGLPLAAGDTISLDIANTDAIWMKADVIGESAIYLWIST
jgi:hypothetical protein